MPYTLAIHAGRDANGQEHNPHAHLMISERKNDGIERSPEQWFSRANPTDPTKGGAEKSRTFHGREWVENARREWAELTNKTMARLGREERVDHRSYERQGVDQEAGRALRPEGRSHGRSRSGSRPAGSRRDAWSTSGSNCSPSSTRSRRSSPTRAALVRHIEEHPELARGYAGSGGIGPRPRRRLISGEVAMQSALDAFRAQREAADQVHARLTEVAQLLEQLTRQVDAVAGNADLRAVLRDERDWLRQAQQLLVDVRHFREQERLRFWPGVWRRWVLALAFALASAAAAGAGYAWWTNPFDDQLKELRERAALADAVAARRVMLTAAERRQLDRLLGWSPSTK